MFGDVDEKDLVDVDLRHEPSGEIEKVIVPGGFVRDLRSRHDELKVLSEKFGSDSKQVRSLLKELVEKATE